MTYESDGAERIVTGHTGRMFILLTVLLVCIQLTQRLLPPLLPTIIDDLAITAFLAGAALTLSRVARAVMEFPSGRAADQLTRTTVIVVCIVLVTAGVTVLALAQSYVTLLVGVTVFGAGFGLYGPSSRALLSDLFEEKRGRAFGIHLTGGDISGVVAAGVALVIVSVATWRGAFLPLAVVLVPLLVAFYVLSREPIRTRSVDLGLRPTLSRLFRDPALRWLVVVYSLFVMASSGMISFLPTFLIEVHGFAFAFASSAFALVYAVGIVVKPASGTLSDRVPRPLVAGGSLVLAGGGLAAVVAAPVKWMVIGGVVVYALGQRSVPPALQAFLMDRFPDESMGGDLGAVRTVYMTVGSLGPGYTGFVASTTGFVPAYVSLLLFFLVGGLILLWFSTFGWPSSK
jgi:predicted MFS family arabinose efflux permease